MQPSDQFISDRPPVFLLVHGTWARDARWTRPDSTLTCYLADEFPNSSTEAIAWSGRNRFADRLEGSRVVERAIRSYGELNRPVFLVGHSHGGSAVAYAIRDNPELRHHVAGAVFMGTPFMSFALRGSSEMLYRATLLLLLSVFFAAIGFFVGYFAVPDPWRGDHPIQEFLAVGVVAVLLVAFLWAGTRLMRSSGVLQAQINRVEKEIQTFDTSTVDAVPTLFLRTTGDEVALVMAFLQLLAFVSNVVSSVTAWALVRMIEILARLRRSFAGRLVVILLALSLVFAVTGAGLMSRTFGINRDSVTEFANPLADLEMNVTSRPLMNVALETAFRIGALAVDLTAGTVLLLSVVLTVLLVITLLIATATYAVFGRWDPLGAILLEMAAEPVPHGRQTLVLDLPRFRGQFSVLVSNGF